MAFINRDAALHPNPSADQKWSKLTCPEEAAASIVFMRLPHWLRNPSFLVTPAKAGAQWLGGYCIFELWAAAAVNAASTGGGSSVNALDQ